VLKEVAIDILLGEKNSPMSTMSQHSKRRRYGEQLSRIACHGDHCDKTLPGKRHMSNWSLLQKSKEEEELERRRKIRINLMVLTISYTVYDPTHNKLRE
jgi:hypothetical protein